MEEDSFSYENVKKSKKGIYDKEYENSISDSRDFFQSFRLRHIIQCNNESYKLLLDNRFNLLFHISPIFWIVLYFIKKGN